jgi:hypothetical protein
MKKALPFVFPVAALVLVAFLAFRWYGQQTTRTGEISEFGEGIAIEELSNSELDSVIKGTGDYKTVALEGGEDVLGGIRYEIADGKVRFSVSASLPELETGMYQVWLKATDSEAIKKAFRLEYAKGGFMGSAAISEETVPFEVLVSREMSDDDTLEEIVLRGVISQE